MSTLLFSETQQNEIIRISAENMGLASNDIENCKTFISNYTKLDKLANWETMSFSTALGAATTDDFLYDIVFDGRYVYYAPIFCKTFMRFDTTQNFTNSSAWEKINCSTVLASSITSNSSLTFDGKYVYFLSYSARKHLRVPISKSFTTSESWESMSTTTLGMVVDNAFYGACFDGRYVYVCPHFSDTFLRFDTTLSFNNSSAWEKISMSTVQGAVLLDTAYRGINFDGRYIYFVPQVAVTFLRFDTTQSFTNSSAWERMSISTAQGAAAVDNNYIGNSCFDGRYVYMSPCTPDTFIRFDTTKSFTNSSAWEKMNMSTATKQALADVAYAGCTFDGCFVYYASMRNPAFIKFDTAKSFTNSNAWEVMSVSTVQGSSSLTNQYYNCQFDGKYIYFCPDNSRTLVRVLACNNNINTFGRK